MSEKVSSDLILECYRRAAEARRISDAAADLCTKSEFLEIEQRWLYLARTTMGPVPMLVPEDYEQLAERFAKLASASSERIECEALRTLASDYFARAAKLRAKSVDR
jgi:hypothetical protein